VRPANKHQISLSLWYVIPLLAIVVGYIVYSLMAPRSHSFGFFEGTENSQTIRFMITFLATVVGVLLGSIYRELKLLQGMGIAKIPSLNTFFSGIGRSTDLWIGLAGSPIVYSLILQSTDGMSLAGLIVVALQNGFCCLVVLNSFIGRQEAGQNIPPTPQQPGETD
jgi:hypothetical protein